MRRIHQLCNRFAQRQCFAFSRSQINVARITPLTTAYSLPHQIIVYAFNRTRIEEKITVFVNPFLPAEASLAACPVDCVIRFSTIATYFGKNAYTTVAGCDRTIPQNSIENSK